jgi:DNA invertase Pin-like site-specific DNA recombinase
MFMFQNGACYIRVSTDDQTEFSPDAQLKAIKRYAKQNDIVITKQNIFIDEGMSGKRADKRPEFMRMIAMAKSKPKPFDVILVHKFDRFARSREDSVVYKSLLKKEAGIKVVSITESIEDDKFAVILEAMLEAMAEYYSLNLSDEVKKGMTEKAHRGGLQSSPSYGYDVENNKLVVNHEEAKIIHLIFSRFASRSMNMRQIAVYLNNLGVKTKRGNAFESRTVEYIVNNPVYIGKIRWTPTERMRRNYHHPDTIITDGEHEPLIDMDTWNKAQEVIKENKEIYRKREKTTTEKSSWVSGLLRCAFCGRTFVKNGTDVLVCNGYAKGTCKISGRIKIEQVEQIVLDLLKETYSGKIEINIVPQASAVVEQAEYELLQERLHKIDDKELRIKEAYEDGIDTLDEYRHNKNRLREERKNLIHSLKELKEHLITGDGVEPEITKRIKNVYDLLTNESIDMETKYKTAHFLINQIIYSKPNKTLKIEYK